MWPKSEVPRLPEGCPWSTWAPPNIKWCEDNLCSWVTAPANTWSNLGFILVAAVLWRMARKDLRGAGAAQANSGGMDSWALLLFAPAAAAVGVSSILFHASYTFFFQFFDYVGMYIFLFLPITLNLRRQGRLGPRFHLPAYAIFIAGTSAMIPVLAALGVPIQLTIVVLVGILLAQEFSIRFLKGRRAGYFWFRAALGAFAVASAFTLLDATRTWCVADNHWLQPHGMWHLFAALALYFLYLFYRQFFVGGRSSS